MKSYLEIFRYTIKYKLTTFMVVLCNMFFVVFNLLSLVLFIPVLQLIFKDPESINLVSKPHFHWGIPAWSFYALATILFAVSLHIAKKTECTHVIHSPPREGTDVPCTLLDKGANLAFVINLLQGVGTSVGIGL